MEYIVRNRGSLIVALIWRFQRRYREVNYSIKESRFANLNSATNCKQYNSIIIKVSPLSLLVLRKKFGQLHSTRRSLSRPDGPLTCSSVTMIFEIKSSSTTDPMPVNYKKLLEIVLPTVVLRNGKKCVEISKGLVSLRSTEDYPNFSVDCLFLRRSGASELKI